MLVIQNLSYNFGTHRALKDCSFSIKKGDFLFLSGPSGAGKSTLLRMLYADLPIQSGQVHIAGFNLNTITPKQLTNFRRQVSFVFQDFKILLERTVFENIALPLEIRFLSGQSVLKRVQAVCRGLGLSKCMNLKCKELSGGEQQRVAIARAVVINPQVLLADEPTGNLDPELSVKLVNLFMQFNSYGTTVILATHSREILKQNLRAKLLRLENGYITFANWSDAKQFQSGN